MAERLFLPFSNKENNNQLAKSQFIKQYMFLLEEQKCNDAILKCKNKAILTLKNFK